MAIWDFRPKGDLWTGVAVGAGLLAAPVVISLAWSATRPVLKVILKGGFMLYETGRQILGEATEEPGRGKAKTIVASRPAPAPTMKKHEETEEEATEPSGLWKSTPEVATRSLNRAHRSS